MNIEQIKIKQILEVSKSILENYIGYLSAKETDKIEEIALRIKNESHLNIKELEEFFAPILERIWNQELKSGKYIIISWNKYTENKAKGDVTFATLSKVDNITSFCNLEEGTEYEISWKALLGACPKDGATLIQEKEKRCKYTIGEINGKVINSFNHASKFITPIQLVEEVPNDYKSKYNELILDSSLIRDIRKINLNDKRSKKI